jgi:hypothetical protein
LTGEQSADPRQIDARNVASVTSLDPKRVSKTIGA